MRSFQFPIKAANRDFLARVSNRTKLFFVSSTMDQRAEQEEQYFRGEDYKAQYLCGNLLLTFQKIYCHRQSKNVVLYHDEASTWRGGGGEQSVKLDHLSRFASRCLTTPTPGEVILGAMHRGSFFNTFIFLYPETRNVHSYLCVP